ncbi:MAG: TlpA family protein disulfide reductase [Acidobacteriota bacterium]|nr:MAG: TlpA family protein disulfide reductase [Acidobacteriota bacterium]
MIRLVSKTLRALLLCCALALTAAPSLGASDVPELPTADGSGDTPDMTIRLVPNELVPGKAADSMRLSSVRGKVVMIDMFWSKCPHCEEHAPHVVELYTKYKNSGFAVLGLATDKPDKIEDVKAFMRKAKINYPVGFITTEVIAYYADSHNHGVPQMVLFGRDGKMVKRMIGWTDKVSKELTEVIDSQMAKAQTAGQK